MLSVTFIVIGWDELLAENRNVGLICFSMEKVAISDKRSISGASINSSL